MFCPCSYCPGVEMLCPCSACVCMVEMLCPCSICPGVEMFRHRIPYILKAGTRVHQT